MAHPCIVIRHSLSVITTHPLALRLLRVEPQRRPVQRRREPRAHVERLLRHAGKVRERARVAAEDVPRRGLRKGARVRG